MHFRKSVLQKLSTMRRRKMEPKRLLKKPAQVIVSVLRKEWCGKKLPGRQGLGHT
jgi:hypothetical protein